MRKNCSKVIIENFFEPCILFLLTRKASYGYELKNQLHEQCGCTVNIGNLYRCLAKLQKGGFISKKKSSSVIGPDRLTYAITPKGKKLLQEWMKELESGMITIQNLITNVQKLYDRHEQ